MAPPQPAYWERGPFVPVLIRIGTAFRRYRAGRGAGPRSDLLHERSFFFTMARHWFKRAPAF